MKLKRISAIVLALAMVASTAALAAEEPNVILDDDVVYQVNKAGIIDPEVVVDEDVIRDVNHDQGDISLLGAPMGGLGGGLMIPIAIARTYATVLSINGEPLVEYTYDKDIPGFGSETMTQRIEALPSVPAGYVPMRAIAQADHGYASWYKGTTMSSFSFANHYIGVSFLDMSVSVDDEPIEGAVAILEQGTTYVPISVIAGLEGVEVEDHSENGVENYNIKTPNGEPLPKLAYQLMETAGMGGLSQSSLEELVMIYGEELGFNEEMMTDGLLFWSMTGMSPDILVLAKLADESKQEEVQAAFEAYQASKLAQFNWGYLMPQLPKVENAQLVFEDGWVLFLIGENAEDAVGQFRANVQTLNAETEA